MISVELECVLFAARLDDIDCRWLQRYPEHPLHTLDALHLTLAADLAVSMLATADGVMADAAVSMGLQVVRF